MNWLIHLHLIVLIIAKDDNRETELPYLCHCLWMVKTGTLLGTDIG